MAKAVFPPRRRPWAPAQPIVTVGYREKIPEHRTPISGLYLATMSQIYPEDRGQNYSIKMGEKVAEMATSDHATK